MKLVSRKTLEALASIHEADESSFSYEDFLKTYDNVMQDIKTKTNKPPFFYAYQEIRDSYLKDKCPPIEFISEGSSRAAYACLGGKCLKIAMSSAGIAQNKQESKTFSSDVKYSCFTRLYEFDKKNGASLMTECCARATDSSFDKAYDIRGGTYTVYSFLRSGVNFKFDILKTLDYYISRVNDLKDSIGSDEALKAKYGSDTEAMNKAIIRTENNIKNLQKEADFMKKVLNDKGPLWQVIRDIFSFYSKHNVDELALDDLQNPDNWGLAIRSGKIVPVIIDAGLNTDIYNKYYAE